LKYIYVKTTTGKFNMDHKEESADNITNGDNFNMNCDEELADDGFFNDILRGNICCHANKLCEMGIETFTNKLRLYITKKYSNNIPASTHHNINILSKPMYCPNSLKIHQKHHDINNEKGLAAYRFEIHQPSVCALFEWANYIKEKRKAIIKQLETENQIFDWNENYRNKINGLNNKFINLYIERIQYSHDRTPELIDILMKLNQYVILTMMQFHYKYTFPLPPLYDTTAYKKNPGIIIYPYKTWYIKNMSAYAGALIREHHNKQSGICLQQVYISGIIASRCMLVRYEKTTTNYGGIVHICRWQEAREKFMQETIFPPPSSVVVKCYIDTKKL